MLSVGRQFDYVIRRFSSFISVPEYVTHFRSYFAFDEVRPDVFQSTCLNSIPQGGPKAAYGGLIFTQSLAAAENTVPNWVYPHSVHSFFIHNVDTDIPIQYEVRRIRNGRSFFTRSVEGVQNGEIVFTSQVSFQKEEPHSIVHKEPMPTVTHWIKSIEANGGSVPKKWLLWLQQYISSNSNIFDCRLVESSFSSHPIVYYYWFRTAGSFPDCSKTHRYLLAYIIDSLMATSIVRSHFINSFSHSMIFSLTYTIVFHEPQPCANKWFLIKVFSEEGHHLCSCTQDVLVRSRNKTSFL